jgi:phosphohistidine phosphatase
MRLLLIRHAIAVPHGTPGVEEDERPLTREGARRFRKAARGLACVVARPDALLTSPLPRAFQTANLAGRAWGRMTPVKAGPLATGDVEGLADLLARQPQEATVALVGHEPHMSSLLSRLLAGSIPGRFTFRKGGAALVELPGPFAEGGQLVWFLPPRVLRRLG